MEEDVNLFFMHDDIAIEQGMVFRPKWYRQYIFPLYEYILEPVKTKKGVKVAFVSDGNYGAVLEDLVNIGFDGFVVNSPAMDLGEISRRFGDRIFLAGGIDTNILTLGKPDDVTRAVTRCLENVNHSKGFFLHSGGDLPHNIPSENMYAYFQATGRLGKF
jgi:uroporphyrinogen-III decarboxylase